MSDTYILDGHVAVPCDDLFKWARWYETANRHVDKDVRDGIRVSTVFIGLDHSFGDGPPLLFETMIFGGLYDEYQERCSTWEQAEQMHKAACALAFEDKP